MADNRLGPQQALSLVVKAPNDKIASQNVSCNNSWLVKDLKEYLSESYPTHPHPSSQRIIHAGKLLKDETPLIILFKDSSNTQTVHLVCRNSKVPDKQVAEAHANINIPIQDPFSAITRDEMEQYQRAYYEYLQQFYMNNSDTSQSNDSSLPSYPSWCNYPQASWPPFSPWVYYGSQYSGNYWQYPNYPASSIPTIPTTGQPEAAANAPNVPAGVGNDLIRGARAMLAGLGVVEDVAPNEVVPVNVEQDAVQQQQQPQAPQQQQGLMMGNPMAAGFMGGEEVGENGGNMDFIDRFYMIFRLCLFIGLCFAYSSLDKAIIVFSVAAYVYFYNIYRRHAAVRQAVVQAQQPRVERPVIEVPAPPSNSDNNGTNNETPDQQLRERVSAEDQHDPTENIAPVQEPEAGLVRLRGTLRLVASTSYQFVSSLIASLIPEQPPPIRLD